MDCWEYVVSQLLQRMIAGSFLLGIMTAGFLQAVPPVLDRPQNPAEGSSVGSGPMALLQWATALSSQQFAVRQRATRQLLQAKQAAIPVLKDAAYSQHSETIWRAITVLEQMACDVHDVQLRMAALEALKQMENATDPRTRRRSATAVKHHSRWRQGHARLMISRWGGKVQSYGSGNKQALRVRLDKTWKGGDDGLTELLFLGPVNWMSMETAPVTDDALQHIQSLIALERLYLGQTRITGKGLPYLKSLKNLRHLSLRYLDIHDQTLRHLVHVPQLDSLGLDDTALTDQGLIHLRHLPQLRQLWLDRTQITAAGLVHLRSLPALNRLNLVNTQVVGKGLAELRHLPDLKYLTLKGVALTDEGIRELSQIRQLETLGLDATPIQDRQLPYLFPLQNLQTLWLSHSKITDKGLRQLEQMKQLKRVYVQGLDVSAETADWFKKTLPECRLYR